MMDDGIRHPLLAYMWYLTPNYRHLLLKRLKATLITFQQTTLPWEINLQQLSTMLADNHFIIVTQNLNNFFTKKFTVRRISKASIEQQALLDRFNEGLDFIQMINNNFVPHHFELKAGYTIM